MKHSGPIRNYVNLALGESKTAERAYRAQRVAEALDYEAEQLTGLYNATDGNEKPVLVGVAAGRLVLLRLLEGDDPTADLVEAAVVGGLAEATLQRYRRPESVSFDSEIVGVAIEHPRLPGGRLDFSVRHRGATEILEALEDVVATQ
jgi:hypothetical protein